MAVWKFDNIGCIPRSVGFIYAIGLGTVFIIAVTRKDVTPYMPYISETGANSPESGLFSIALYMIATLGMATMLIRYMIIEECIQGASKVLTRLSKASLVLGLLSMCGMVIVGAYPMLTVPSAHQTGALILFFCCCVYGLVETIVSFKMVPCHISRSTSIIRATITSIAALILVTMLTVPIIGLRDMRANLGWSGGKYPGDPGFAYVVTGAACEWALSLLFLAFFLTFVVEFRGIALLITVHYKHPNENQVNDYVAEDQERRDSTQKLIS